mgnify:CR=1 FL=1
MDTFIEEMATVFGWTEADYSKGDLLDYYRANVKNDVKAIGDSSLMIRTDTAATQVLKKFVSLYLDTEEYIDQNRAFVFIVRNKHGHKVYADFRALAVDVNHKYERLASDVDVIEYMDTLDRDITIAPFITAH